MSESMSDMDWTTPAGLAELVAEELAGAMERVGIRFIGVGRGMEDNCVTMAFQGIRDAERLMDLGVPYDPIPGSFYDRAVASCLTLTAMSDDDDPVEEGDVETAIDAGWRWTVHPARTDGRTVWHVSVDMSSFDAQQLAANLNAAHHAADRS